MQHASPDDEIRLDHAVIPHLSEEIKSQLQDVGFLGGYALLPSEYPCDRSYSAKKASGCAAKCRQPWDICFKTQVAVRAVLLTANEWEYFVSNGEDLSGDKSAAVRKWLQPHLQSLRTEAIEKQGQLEKLGEAIKEEHALAASMLRERWSQISVHLGLYIDSDP